MVNIIEFNDKLFPFSLIFIKLSEVFFFRTEMLFFSNVCFICFFVLDLLAKTSMNVHFHLGFPKKWPASQIEQDIGNKIVGLMLKV